jgi:hypothetical protein
MRMWGFHPISCRPVRRAPIALAVGAALLASAAAGYAQTVPQASPAARTPITLRSGKSFRPTLGDWEGTINGLPASFELSYGHTSGAARYGLDDLVAVRPAGCPAIAGHYMEDVLASTVATPLGANGSLGLSRFKFGGSLSGARSATLTRTFRVGGCTRTLSWTMRPATRRTVTDGVWTAAYSGGGTSTLRVQAAGRLATAVTIPPAMTRCNGLAGKFDMFIGSNGTATLSQPGLRATIQFTRRGGSGRINSDGTGCGGGPFRFSVKLKQAGK